MSPSLFSISIDPFCPLTFLNTSHSLQIFSPLLLWSWSCVFHRYDLLFIIWSYISCIFYLTYGVCENFWDFSKLVKVLWNFWDGLCLNGFKTLCIASHLHYNHDSCILDMCLLSCNDCVLLSLDWAKLMMFLNLHVICSCIFMYMYFHFLIFLYITVLVLFWLSLSLSILALVCFYGTSVLEPSTFWGIFFL